jgi:NADPH2:quinone reductase
VAFKAAIAENLKQRIWPKIEAGEIKPVLAARFALKQATQAHALMESSQHIGKIVLTTGR